MDEAVDKRRSAAGWVVAGRGRSGAIGTRVTGGVTGGGADDEAPVWRQRQFMVMSRPTIAIPNPMAKFCHVSSAIMNGICSPAM